MAPQPRGAACCPRAGESVTRVRWKPARDGFVESHDGRWQIYPMYWGCTRPQVYELRRDSSPKKS